MKVLELFEAFDSKVDYDVIKHTASNYHLESTINGRRVKVVASKIPSEADAWDFEFFEKTKQGKWTTAKTGSGGELKVFSFVRTVLEEFISIYNPEVIEFNAFEEDGSERARIYEKFIKRLKIDYKMTVSKSHTTGQATLTLKRK